LRLLGVFLVGVTLVGAGLAAPASVEQGAAGEEMRFGPQVARPGQRVRIDVPSCPAGEHKVESQALAGTARLEGRAGTADLKPEIGDGTYTVVVQCRSRRVTGRLEVSTERSWPSLLPSALNPQMARAAGDR
jgi:hypothetical protein